MANTVIYPYGISGSQPSGAWSQKIIDMQSTLDLLAPLAFRETPNVGNSIFKDVLLFPLSTSGTCGLRIGNLANNVGYFLSPIYELNGDTYDLIFNTGSVAESGERHPGLLFFDENYEYRSYWSATTAPRSVSGSVGDFKYFRMSFPADKLLEAYIIDNATGETIFDGSNINTSVVKSKEDFLSSSTIPDSWRPNSRGDYIGWNFSTADSASTTQRTDVTRPIFKRIGINATDMSYSISKIVELPKNTTIDVEFSCGVVNTDLMLRLLNPSAGTANYYTANENPRVVSINTATWTHVQLYFLTTNYADCYIKDATNNVILWQGAALTE